ncbi:MAG: hypothetical protein LLG20_20115 [Acidobacteriales bacterium]|nr:hypothetical protein [Terriglobales bacterium]
MRHLENHESPDRAEAELDSLFAAYRSAVPDPEPSADFMPRVWQRIEARRSVGMSLRHLAQSFITAAAAICLLLSTLLLRPAAPPSVFTTASYVEVLAGDPEPERMAYADISHEDVSTEESQR